MAKAGAALTDAEAAEYQAYSNAGLTQPEKFAGVVVDATKPTGTVYRWQTAEEAKAAEAGAKAAEEAVTEDERLMARVRGEAAKRGGGTVVAADAPPPPMPAG